VLRYREVGLLEFPNAAMRKTDNVQLHISRLFRSFYSLPFTCLSYLYPFLTPLTNRLEIQFPSQPPESCRLCSPSFSACCFVASFAFSFSACFSRFSRALCRCFSSACARRCFRRRCGERLAHHAVLRLEEVSA
jgi:hypothetical protein